MALRSNTVVFIHGMYMNGGSWAPWVAHAAARGYTCHTPSWPFHDGEPAHLRQNIDSRLGSLTFGDVTDAYRRFIDRLDAPPMLIGHSIGGLVVQKLLNQGYGSAGVAISPAPPRGIVSFSPHFLRANFPHVNPLAGNEPVTMTPSRFHYTFCNTMSEATSREAFEQYVVPESRNVPRSTLTKQAAIDFRVGHRPLLLVVGDRDHLTPAAMVRRNAARYRGEGNGVEVVEFEHRSHFICNQDGWPEVADHALGWLGGL